ncbi:MAG TPA: hypothetical protein ENN09_07200 [Planctomycetes bacterium]|nr:hypothetical protein [Planctomycetota bacterium]
MTTHSAQFVSKEYGPVDNGFTLKHLIDEYLLDAGFLNRIQVSEMSFCDKTAVRIPYLNGGGTTLAAKFLVGAGDARWRKGDSACLFGLDNIAEASQSGTLVIAADEIDCITLRQYGFHAVGLPSAAGWDETRDAKYLHSIPVVYVPSPGGVAPAWLHKSLVARKARLIDIGNHSSVSQMHIEAPSTFPNRWRQAMASAKPYADACRAELTSRAQAAWPQCESLANAPDVLSVFADELQRCGFAGDQQAAKLLFLMLVSRLHGKPVSAVVKGPAAAGKSHLVQQVLKFFPDDAYVLMTSCSNKALVRFDQPLKHRFVVINEAAGIKGDTMNYFVRSLLSEGKLKYTVTDGGGAGVRTFEIEGPTGLISTSTKLELDPELETRLFSIPVDDSAAQTKRVLGVIAEKYSATNSNTRPVNLAPWHAYQVWLAGQHTGVHIPFSTTLASLLCPLELRLSRDMDAFLSLVRAHAFLHQVTRQRDSSGNIVATLDDYSAVRELTNSIISSIVGATLPGAVRETVEALRELRLNSVEVRLSLVAQKLGVSAATASRRLADAARHGYVNNLERRNGFPGRYVLGDPLPDEGPGLFPEPDVLATAWGGEDSVEGLLQGLPLRAVSEAETTISPLHRSLPPPPVPAGGVQAAGEIHTGRGRRLWC